MPVIAENDSISNGGRRNNLPVFVNDYFTRMECELRQIEIDFDDGENYNPDIKKIFVPLPTNITIGIKVHNRSIIEIIENNVSYNCKTNNKYSSFFRNLNNTLIKSSSSLPLIFKPYWKDGIIEDYFTLNAIEAISSLRQCVVLGSPGSGKSVLLQFLTLLLIEQYNTDSDLIRRYSNSSVLFEESIIPIYVPLRKMFQCNNETINGITVEDFLKFVFGDSILDQRNEVDLFFRTNKFIFLFDGVDEIFPDSQTIKCVNSLVNVTSALVSNSYARGTSSDKIRVVFSSRLERGKKWIPMGFASFSLVEMDINSQIMLADNIFREKEMPNVTEQRNRLFLEIKNSSLDKKLIGTPLIFSLLIYIFISRGSLPSFKSMILEDGIKLLIIRWRHKILEIDHVSIYNSQFYDPHNLLGILEEIAYTTVLGDSVIRPNSLIFPVYILDGKIMQVLKDDTSLFSDNDIGKIELNVRNCLIDNIGIIRERYSTNNYVKEYEFSHRNFQEYLAAKRLSQPQFFSSSIKQIFNSNPNDYQEVLLMLIEVLHDEKNYGTMIQFLLMIVDFMVRNSETKQETNRYMFWWAWFLTQLISHRDYSVLSSFSEYSYFGWEDALKTACEYMTRSLSTYDIDLKKRYDCGKFLSELPCKIENHNLHLIHNISLFGDTRKGIGVEEDGLPDILWCKVPSGKFTFGLTHSDICRLKNLYPDSSFEREIPACELDVKSFYISKYPVTFKQFKAFYHDGGYEKKQYWDWSEVSLRWFNERVRNINDIFDNCDNAPVVNISWIEAKSYCVWLSRKTNKTIRLPYEFEWEYIAKKHHVDYSISEEFNNSIYISNSVSLSKAAPVGIYPYPQDMPSDLNGNVWEWTQSIMPPDNETLEGYTQRFAEVNPKDFWKIQTNTKMVVKGGCFLNSSFQSRNTYRGRDYIFNHITRRQGFRLVMEVEE